MANAYTLGFFSLRGSEFSLKSSIVVFSWGLVVVVVVEEAGGGISATSAVSRTSVFLSVFLLNISIALSKASTI